MKSNTNNVGAGSSKLILSLMFLLVCAIAGFITILVITSTESANDKEYIRHAGELRVLSQEIAKNANEAALGKADAFVGLESSTSEFITRWGYLKQGDAMTGLPASPVQVADSMSAVESTWNKLSSDAQQILDSQSSVLNLHSVAASLSETIPSLQTEYEEIVALLVADAAPASQVALAQRQSWLAERILQNVNKILEGGDDAVLASDAFALDAAEFSRAYEAMLTGDAALNVSRINNSSVRSMLENSSGLFKGVENNTDSILNASPELFQVRDAANSISQESATLLAQTSALVERFQLLPQVRPIAPYMGYACGILALALIGLLAVIIYRDTRSRLHLQSDANDRNQQAILRLLDEIADLADGDLTTNATVTEDFTGAIADSINFAIDQLRSLVASINRNSVLVSKAAEATQTTAHSLSEASTNQAREITQASGTVQDIASSIDEISANADESSKVAERSVVIANKGTSAVQNTIHGMDKIREQIQKTSKQIKRLGESSQEIGDIVSLINDIADQTNILSLNAAIQASMAGDAGRGFAVVADEVQRLAERSSAATRQIEVLVKTIQADTNDAVISMEQTTAEVVQGARLAQDAGVALEEIEEVSNDLARLIRDISSSATQQSGMANSITSRMNIIQEITSQTSSGVRDVADSIGNLTEMAKEMGSSVAGFKLPEVDIKKANQSRVAPAKPGSASASNQTADLVTDTGEANQEAEVQVDQEGYGDSKVSAA